MTAESGSADAGVLVRVVFGTLRRLTECANIDQALQMSAAAEGANLDEIGPAIDDALRAATHKDRATLPYLTLDRQRQVLRETGAHLTKAVEDSAGSGAL